MVSVVDPDSRHIHKTVRSYRDGYKAHFAVEPDTGLITACRLTAGDAADGPVGVELLEGDDQNLEVLADSAYGSADTREALQRAGHRQTIKPIPLRRHIEGGFTRDDFDVDLDAETVTCPAGHTVPITSGVHARFKHRCAGCPLRARCTTSKRGMHLTLHVNERQLQHARRRAREPDFTQTYRAKRPMVERTIAWFTNNGHRKVRYRGTEHNQHWITLRSAAINLRRLVNLGLRHTGEAWALS